MSLSDREQRMLEEMERQLYAEDPRFASNLRKQTAPRSARTGLAAILTLVGVVLIGVGVSMNQPILGIIGFLAALFGLYEIIMAATRRSEPSAKTGQKKDKTSISKRAEERFRRRREGDE